MSSTNTATTVNLDNFQITGVHEYVRLYRLYFSLVCGQYHEYHTINKLISKYNVNPVVARQIVINFQPFAEQIWPIIEAYQLEHPEDKNLPHYMENFESWVTSGQKYVFPDDPATVTKMWKCYYPKMPTVSQNLANLESLKQMFCGSMYKYGKLMFKRESTLDELIPVIDGENRKYLKQSTMWSFFAAKYGRVDVLKYLDVTEHICVIKTALAVGAKFDHHEVVEWAVERSTEPIKISTTVFSLKVAQLLLRVFSTAEVLGFVLRSGIEELFQTLNHEVDLGFEHLVWSAMGGNLSLFKSVGVEMGTLDAIHQRLVIAAAFKYNCTEIMAYLESLGFVMPERKFAKHKSYLKNYIWIGKHVDLSDISDQVAITLDRQMMEEIQNMIKSRSISSIFHEIVDPYY